MYSYTTNYLARFQYHWCIVCKHFYVVLNNFIHFEIYIIYIYTPYNIHTLYVAAATLRYTHTYVCMYHQS